MKRKQTYSWVYLVGLILIGCTPIVEDKYADKEWFTDSGSLASVSSLVDTAPLISNMVREVREIPEESTIETKNISPKSLVEFAQTLIGIPYKYASTDPKAGFDCSGFITYVFNHFDIAVPRSSVGFTNLGEEVPKINSKPGDLILFTGTDSTVREVGHMGIITFNSPDTLLFIHSTSGKLNSVTVTPLNKYYQSRFVKIVRIFKENNKVESKS